MSFSTASGMRRTFFVLEKRHSFTFHIRRRMRKVSAKVSLLKRWPYIGFMVLLLLKQSNSSKPSAGSKLGTDTYLGTGMVALKKKRSEGSGYTPTTTRQRILLPLHFSQRPYLPSLRPLAFPPSFLCLWCRGCGPGALPRARFWVRCPGRPSGSRLGGTRRSS